MLQSHCGIKDCGNFEVATMHKNWAETITLHQKYTRNRHTLGGIAKNLLLPLALKGLTIIAPALTRWDLDENQISWRKSC
jgi:hypothetical protein